MIKGIGTDIIEIERIRKAVLKEYFVKRVFTANEIAYAESKGDFAQTFAGIFCAKESIIKAKGRGFPFHELEILHDENGKPYCSDEKIFISISHCKEYATAMAVIEE
ncbi:MAG: holo-ACP synthase [Clostridia bacterium]